MDSRSPRLERIKGYVHLVHHGFCSGEFFAVKGHILGRIDRADAHAAQQILQSAGVIGVLMRENQRIDGQSVALRGANGLAARPARVDEQVSAG